MTIEEAVEIRALKALGWMIIALICPQKALEELNKEGTNPWLI